MVHRFKVRKVPAGSPSDKAVAVVVILLRQLSLEAQAIEEWRQVRERDNVFTVCAGLHPQKKMKSFGPTPGA